MSAHRSEPDYIDRTIESVRNFQHVKDNCWPQWANIFADEIEDLRFDLAHAQSEWPSIRNALAALGDMPVDKALVLIEGMQEAGREAGRAAVSVGETSPEESERDLSTAWGFVAAETSPEENR